MKKHFLLLMLMALLPFAGWAIDISSFNVQITGTGAYEYNGKVQGLELTVQMANASLALEKTAYDVVVYKDANKSEVVEFKNAGTYYVTAKGKGVDYSGETTPIEVTITPKSISEVTITTPSSESFTYDGTPKTYSGAITVKDDENTLVVGVDYTLSYENNVNAGEKTAKVVVTGKGNYRETANKPFSISAKTLTPEMVPASAPVFEKDYTSYVVDLTGVDVTVKDGIKTLTKGTDYVIKVYSNEERSDENEVTETAKDYGTYYLAVSSSSNTNYTGKIPAGTLKINQVDLFVYPATVTTPYSGAEQNATTASSVQYGGLLANDEPDDTKLTIKPSAKTNAGTYDIEVNNAGTALAKNYNITLLGGKWTISPAPLTVTAPNKGHTFGATSLATVSINDCTFGEDQVKGSDSENLKAAMKVEIVGVTTESKADVYDKAVQVSAKDDAETAAKTTLANYDVTYKHGTYTVSTGKYTVIAQNATFEYGEKIEINIVDGAGNPVKGVTYKIKKGDTVYEAENLNPDTYQIVIDEGSVKVPENYTEPATTVPGTLTIRKKDLTITINAVNLNSGDGIDELKKYASVADYELVGEDVIAFDYKFNADLTELLSENKLKEAADYSSATFWTAETNTLANAVDAQLITSTTENPNDNAKYNITFTKGNIVLGAAGSLVLDPTNTQLSSKIADANGTTANISFSNISMLANEWYAMVLPFETSPKDLVKALDTYVVVNTLDNSSMDASASKKVVTANFKLEYGQIPAGTPFLIKAAEALNWSTKVTSPIAATISSAINNKSTDYATFTGTYASNESLKWGLDEDGETEDSNAKYRWLRHSDSGKDHSWVNPKTNPHTLAPMEAYLILHKDADGARVFVEDIDSNGTTAIKSLSADQVNGLNINAAEGWYNLNGVKIEAPTQKGIYIHNGKKVVIK